MKTFILGKEYIALSLIKAKKSFFNESFITTSELGQFDYYLQQEFNKRDLDIIISSNALSSDDFNINGDTIMASNSCSYGLNTLPMNVLTVLYDSNLIADFFEQLEKDKLQMIENKKETVFKIYRK